VTASHVAVPAADADENSPPFLSGKAIFGGTVTATRGEHLWTMANNHELSIIMNSVTTDGGGR
jgi:hypothetical protein